MSGIAELLPAAEGDVDGPVSGTVFKIERGPAGEKVAYIRMFSGTVRTRERLWFGRDGERKVTAISAFDNGSTVRRGSVCAGEIGKLWGLAEIQIGDVVGRPRASGQYHQFAPPTLETIVGPVRHEDKGRLRLALAQLAEQDPLINVRQDDVRQEISVSLYGEVQKEVIQATLATDYGLDVTFRETTTICIERPVGTGEAVERLREPPNPFLATVGLRIEPAAGGSGVEVRLEVELGSMPPAFFRGVEDTVRETLRQGIYGWEVTDCTITMTHSGYLARHSHAHQGFAKEMSSTGGDFRNLTPLVLMSALEQAGTVVCEPIHRFHLEVPAETLGPVVSALARLHAVPHVPTTGDSWSMLEGDIPAARVHELRQQLPALTRGEGVLESAFDRYQPLTGAIPTRPRSDHNPLNREQYLLHVARRV
jgi:ribosomal protection tetracycline resistance protein